MRDDLAEAIKMADRAERSLEREKPYAHIHPASFRSMERSAIEWRTKANELKAKYNVSDE